MATPPPHRLYQPSSPTLSFRAARSSPSDRDEETTDLYEKLTERDSTIDELQQELRSSRKRESSLARRTEAREEYIERLHQSQKQIGEESRTAAEKLSREQQSNSLLRAEHHRNAGLLESLTDEVSRLRSRPRCGVDEKTLQEDRGTQTVNGHEVLQSNEESDHNGGRSASRGRSRKKSRKMPAQRANWKPGGMDSLRDTSMSSQESAISVDSTQLEDIRFAASGITPPKRSPAALCETESKSAYIHTEACLGDISNHTKEYREDVSQPFCLGHLANLLIGLVITWALASLLVCFPVHLIQARPLPVQTILHPYHQLTRCRAIEAMCQLFPNPKSQAFYAVAVHSWEASNDSSSFCPYPPVCSTPPDYLAEMDPGLEALRHREQRRWHSDVATSLEELFFLIHVLGLNVVQQHEHETTPLLFLWYDALLFRNARCRSQSSSRRQRKCLEHFDSVVEAVGGSRYLEAEEAVNGRDLLGDLLRLCQISV
ncbi:Hypothetical predicted protein [Lecanosticta acicola]|uniref:Uncharacterized protein n=1 Tax=Lecanosticta acicola TaxID=111012 RepID=A0AAI9ECD8_9PEZI|nr:Hypothetical predicted protein [Lecanosticta acicola]